MPHSLNITTRSRRGLEVWVTCCRRCVSTKDKCSETRSEKSHVEMKLLSGHISSVHNNVNHIWGTYLNLTSFPEMFLLSLWETSCVSLMPHSLNVHPWTSFLTHGNNAFILCQEASFCYSEAKFSKISQNPKNLAKSWRSSKFSKISQNPKNLAKSKESRKILKI